MSTTSSAIQSGSKLQLEPGSWQEVAYDIYIGIVVGVSHSLYFIFKFLRETFVHPVQILLGLREEETKEKLDNEEQTLKVVGVGYGRTGTYSLTLALEELGLPTLHTQHLYEHEDVFGMWLDEVFQPSIAVNSASLRKPDLSVVTSHGFRATADLPMALYYEQIMEEYPDCKFILTTRKNSEEWFRSWDTLTKSITQPASFGNYISAVRPYSIYLRWLYAMVNNDNSYLTRDYPLPDQNKEASIASYEEHNRRVRATIPKERLLEYSVKEGWDPLCNFLEVEHCPTTPFPKTNSARSVQVQAISSFIVPFSIVFIILFLVMIKVFERATGVTFHHWANRKINNLWRSMTGQKVIWEDSPKKID